MPVGNEGATEGWGGKSNFKAAEWMYSKDNRASGHLEDKHTLDVWYVPKKVNYFTKLQIYTLQKTNSNHAWKNQHKIELLPQKKEI